MQKVIFDTTAPRSFEAAYPNNYIKGLPHPERVMSVHDIVYIAEGEWEIILDGVSNRLLADDLIILPAYIQHGGVLPCTDGTKTYFTHVSASDGDGFFTDTDIPSGESCGSLTVSAVIHCRDYPEVKKAFENLLKIFSADIPCRDMRLDACFKMLLANLYDADIGRKNTPENEFAEKIVGLIHSSPHLFFTSDELAEKFFVCPKTLVSRFREYTGITPSAYQMKYKLEQIAAVIRTQPKTTLRSLAVNFGFCDEFHLSHAFKKMYGVSPKEYRKSRSSR